MMGGKQGGGKTGEAKWKVEDADTTIKLRVWG